MKAEDNPFPYITLAEQASVPATPAAGKAKLYRGTDNKNYVVDDTGAATEFPAASGGGGTTDRLATVVYNPATLSSYSTTSTTIADVDATNLAVTFTAPASGSVMVELTGLAGQSGTTDFTRWALRSGTTTVKRNQVFGGTSGVNRTRTAKFLVTGLTPGASYTYKWAWATSNAASQTNLYAGVLNSDDIPAIMEVFSA
jgi:hypothetical protein